MIICFASIFKFLFVNVQLDFYYVSPTTLGLGTSQGGYMHKNSSYLYKILSVVNYVKCCHKHILHI